MLKAKCFSMLTMLFLSVFSLDGCSGAFLMRAASGPGGISAEDYLFIGIVDFEGEGGKEVAKALASALQKTESKGQNHLKFSYIPVSQNTEVSECKPKLFNRYEDLKQFKQRKDSKFKKSRRDFERKAEKKARKIFEGSHSVQAILTGKMIFNDVMDLVMKKATEIYIMREVAVKFDIILVDGYTGKINGRAHDVWNKGIIFADTHIPREKISLLDYHVEQFVEGRVLKSLSTFKAVMQAVYDYLIKDQFEPPDIMIGQARERAVAAAAAGIIMGTNY